MTSDVDSAAAHEAGHAVAAWLLGRRVTHVALEGGPLDGPHCVDKLPNDRPDRTDLGSVADDACVYAAGTIAAGQDPHPHGQGDFAYLAALAGSATYSEAEAEAFEAWILRRAEAMVAHEHFRFLHEHVTEALERDGELDEDDFRIEVQRADMRYRSMTPDPGPTRVPEPESQELPPMARPRTTEPPTLVQCREGFVALVDGEELRARTGDIHRSEDPLVKRWPELFVELGELPNTPRFQPHLDVPAA
jgi:hypothetical protein